MNVAPILERQWAEQRADRFAIRRFFPFLDKSFERVQESLVLHLEIIFR